MASYKLEWKISAVKELKKLPKNKIPIILKAVQDIQESPYHEGVRKLSGTDFTFRKRIGDYRIIYSVIKSDLTIEIVRVRHRKDVYK